MKKNVFYFAVLLSIFICTVFSGCNFSYEPNLLSTAPTVRTEGNQVSISIPNKTSSAKYINVYRKEIPEDDSEPTIANIGILYPKYAEKSGNAYIFIDLYFKKNHKYVYMVRYAEDEGYTSSKWSNEITTTDGYDDNINLSYNTRNATFSFDKTYFTLKINGTITPPEIENFDKEFTPMLVAKTDSKTQVFPISSINDGEEIKLRNIFPSSFLDTPVTILGIVPQKNTFANNKQNTTNSREVTTTSPSENSSENAGNTEASKNPNDSDNSDETDNPENPDNSEDSNNQDEDETPEEKNKDIKEIIWLECSQIKIKRNPDCVITVPSSAQSDGFDYSRKASAK